MKSLEIPNLSDEAYELIARRAQDSGRSIGEQAAAILVAALESDKTEALLLAEITAERGEMAKDGVYLTDEGIDAAIRWGRE